MSFGGREISQFFQGRRLFWALLAATLVADMAVIWLAAALPAQDLPQHLAYARILRDHTDASLPFHATYQVASAFQPYFLAHYLLAGLGRLVSIETAARLLFSVHAVATTLAVCSLVRAADPTNDQEPPWPALLSPLVVWSPVTCMGFLEFMLAVPALLMATASLVGGGREPSWRRHATLAGWSLAVVSIHAVAAGCLLVIAALHAVFSGGRHRARMLGVVSAAVVVGQFAWSALGAHGLGSFSGVDWKNALARSAGLDFITYAFDVKWNDPLLNGNYVLWTALGSFPFWGQFTTVLTGILALIVVLKSRWRTERPDGTAATIPFRRAAAGFAILAWLAPWGLHVPSEITFLNFRMITLALALGIACIPGDLFRPLPARLALFAFSMIFVANFGWRALAFGREAQAPLALLEEAAPRGTMLPLVFHNSSRFFARPFQLAHFLPMYYTVRQGGLSAQFWGRYTHHLPVGHRSRERLPGPPDWQPWLLDEAQLAAHDYVLLQRAGPSDFGERQKAAARVEKLLDGRLGPKRCQDLWCLYRRRTAMP